jgi:hypothetical protein
MNSPDDPPPTAVTSMDQIYRFVDEAVRACRRRGDEKMAGEFESALRLGSSGLEILGAVAAVVEQNRGRLLTTLAPEQVQWLDPVLAFARRSFGQRD